MLDDFVLRAIFAGVGLSLATGPLGAFVVWRRMAYFGDAVAHAAILGVAFALAFSISLLAGALVVAVIVGLSVSALATRGHALDASLGVLAHSALAFGLVALSLLHGVRINLEALLFGDILVVSRQGVASIWVGSLAVLALLAWRWGGLLLATLSHDLAVASGIDPRRERLILTLSLAIVVALGLKVVGALLVGAMLIIPAAAARGFARSPETMALMAVIFGSLATVGGVGASLAADTPTGPSIVVVAALIYLASLVGGRIRIGA